MGGGATGMAFMGMGMNAAAGSMGGFQQPAQPIQPNAFGANAPQPQQQYNQPAQPQQPVQPQAPVPPAPQEPVVTSESVQPEQPAPEQMQPQATDCCINEFPRAPDKASAFLTSLNNALVSSSYSIA